MAGAGYKLFNTGDVLTAAQVNTYLNEQTVMVFADSAARTTALSGVLAEGMVSYLQDTNAVEVYNGTAWVGVSGAGDVTEVQAGVGISVASGTGPIPVITNSSTDLITTAGDLLYGTAADTVARLGIGTANQVLAVNSGATAPEWVTPSAGSSFTYAVFRDEKTSGTNGGTATLGAWRTRDINATQFNDISGASLSSNQITLPAGTYLIEGECQAVGIDINQVRFQNITDSTTAVLGQNMYTEQSTNVGNMARVSGIFTIAGSKAFEFQQQCTFTKATNGFGVANSFGTNVYASITITKVA